MIRKRRNPLRKRKIYSGACVVTTHLRINCHQLIPDSDGVISESPSMLRLHALRFPYRRRGIELLTCISSPIHVARVNKKRAVLPLMYLRSPCFRNIHFDPRGQTWPCNSCRRIRSSFLGCSGRVSRAASDQGEARGKTNTEKTRKT